MIDLHVHSRASDGTDTPAQVVHAASSLKLAAIAISDHDSVDGVDEAIAEGEIAGVEVVPAVEMSSEVGGRDIHFLGYFIDHKDDILLETLASLRQTRFERAKGIVDRLNNLGVELEMADVLAVAGGGAVGRAHIARALYAKGKVTSLPEAFKKFLDRGRPAYLAKTVLSPGEIIAMIHRVAGLASLAHPGVSVPDEFIDMFISYGLNAIEAYHYEHTPAQVKHYIELAERKGVSITGGSDSHGTNSTRGLTLGKVNVPDSVLTELKESLSRLK
ncbi:MAG: PHP domain-containing protein [Actinobacteria bacterium]|nr:PHP domain-containing protein [Actinomycetota bacterium]